MNLLSEDAINGVLPLRIHLIVLSYNNASLENGTNVTHRATPPNHNKRHHPEGKCAWFLFETCGVSFQFGMLLM